VRLACCILAGGLALRRVVPRLFQRGPDTSYQRVNVDERIVRARRGNKLPESYFSDVETYSKYLYAIVGEGSVGNVKVGCPPSRDLLAPMIMTSLQVIRVSSLPTL
jgi:hypothetical protein